MKKVLIVEDEILARLGLRQLVDWRKLELELLPDATDGEEALEMIRNSCPDIILLDLNIPKVSGLEILEFLKKERPDMIFLCTPANPTGAMMRKADLLKILDYCKRAGIVAVIDECFIEFLNEEKADGCIREFLAWKEGMPENGGTLFLLRAFTKTYAMAGLRIGYGFCTDPGLIERMEENWQPWSVSIPAQEAGLAALSDERIPFLKKMRELVEKERKVLSDGLTKAGFTVFHSEANFLLFKDFKTEQESWLYEFFLEHGILIRSCKNYRELDSRFYRICVRTHEENLEFLEILKEYR